MSAADGVDATTRGLWHECSVVGMPRAVVITQLDAGDADFEATLAGCQATSAAASAARHTGGRERGRSVLDRRPPLGEIHDYADGGDRLVRQAGPEHAAAFDTYRGGLIEGIIEESGDDGLMDRYLEGEELPFDVLEKDLLTAVAAGTFHPVLPVSAETGAGVGVLVHLIAVAFPTPASIRCRPSGRSPAGAGRRHCRPGRPTRRRGRPHPKRSLHGAPLLVRIFSGTLRSDRAVHVSGHLDEIAAVIGEGHAGHDEDVRPGAVGAPFDGELLPRGQGIAGEVVVVTKLSSAQTSDTISDPDRPSSSLPGPCPMPCCPQQCTR